MHQQMTIRRSSFRFRPKYSREILKVLNQTYQRRFDEMGVPYFCKVARMAEVQYSFTWLGFKICITSTDIINP